MNGTYAMFCGSNNTNLTTIGARIAEISMPNGGKNGRRRVKIRRQTEVEWAWPTFIANIFSPVRKVEKSPDLYCVVSPAASNRARPRRVPCSILAGGGFFGLDV